MSYLVVTLCFINMIMVLASFHAAKKLKGAQLVSLVNFNMVYGFVQAGIIAFITLAGMWNY